MSCETFTTKINDHKYAYTQLSATNSLKLKYQLAGMLGKAITDVVPAIKKKDNVQIEAFGNAIEDIFKNNDPDKVVEVVKQIFVPAFRDEERIDFDKHFTGNTAEMYQVLFWILKCEYGNFISGLGDLL